MKSRPVGRKARSVRDLEAVIETPALHRAVDALAASLRGDGREPPLWQFGEDEIRLIQTLARREVRDPFDWAQFIRKMDETRPLAVQPAVHDAPLAMYLALAQPELLDFWGSIAARGGRRGADPGIGAKAFLFTAAALGHSAHFQTNHRVLHTDHRLRAVFEWVEQTSARSAGRRAGSLAPRTYAQTLRQLHALANRISPEMCMEKNVELVRAVHELLRVQKTRLAIDGSLWRSWTRQVPKQDPATEARIRRVATAATFKSHKDGPHMRGYQFVALVDLPTGLPVTWELWPGNRDEAYALPHLLQTTFSVWPSLHTDVLVADAAWDERWAAKYTLVNYGIHLVARRHPSALEREFVLPERDSPTIAKFLGDGQVICRTHGLPMIRDGFQLDRAGLAPGEPTSRRPRLRLVCRVDPAACGTARRAQLYMDHDWISLAYYPHNLAAGAAELHALRLALLARRNQVEALFSALQVRHKLGLDDAARTRTAKEPTVQALVSIACLMRSALMLADLRIQYGLFAPEFPNELTAVLAA